MSTEATPPETSVDDGPVEPKSDHEDGPSNATDSNGKTTDTVDVIASEQPTNESTASEADTNPSPLKMPSLANLQLHSPSTHIIGTPFAVDSPKFEYPFPESSPQSLSPASASSPSMSASSLVSPPSISPHLPVNPSSALAFTSGFLPPLHLPQFTPAHPKLRSVSPPVPPGLAKKRHKWSLGLLGRRSSSDGSHASDNKSLGSPGEGPSTSSSSRRPSASGSLVANKKEKN